MSFSQKTSSSIILGSVLLLGGFSWIVRPEPDMPGGSPVLFTNAVGQEMTNRSRTSKNVAAGLGIVEPASGTINLSAQMPGVIAAMTKSEGDAIKRNDVLAQLVNDDLVAQLAQAESNVRIEAAHLAIVENGPRPEEIDQAEARVLEEQSSKKLFEAQLQRRALLVRDGAVARETLNEAQRALSVSQQRLDSAQKQLDLLRQGSRSEELEAARATYKLALDKLAEARAILEKSYIRAPIDGIILRQYMEPGEAVSAQPDAVIMQIADTTRLVVRTQIDENDISGLKIGQKAEISAPSLGDTPLPGTVTRISPRLGAKTVTAETPTEKRDTRVLDVIVSLDPGVSVPVYLRVDVVIDLDSQAEQPKKQTMLEAPLRPALVESSCQDDECQSSLNLLDTQMTGAITR
jgi:HlyD family secretion protein